MNAEPISRRLSHRLFGTWIDRLLLVLVLMGIVFGWVHIRQLAGGGQAMVDIYHGRTLLAEYPLRGKKPVQFAAKGEIGVSEIVIANGEVAITKSPCRHKLCVLAGFKHHIGDIIACVPNRILVAIRGGAQNFDAMLE